jgi:hypothetical protein
VNAREPARGPFPSTSFPLWKMRFRICRMRQSGVDPRYPQEHPQQPGDEMPHRWAGLHDGSTEAIDEIVAVRTARVNDSS